MRVPQAMQVVSSSMVNLITLAEKRFLEDGIDLSAMKLLCQKLDRLVDILNSRVDRASGPISSADDPLLEQLLDILGWFSRWKSNIATAADLLTPEMSAQEQKACFLTEQSWFDLQQLILGFVAGCQFYLQLYPKRVVVSRRCNQDICEHHFAHVREAGGATDSVTAAQAMAATGTAAAVRLNTGGKKN
eukprot:FR742824.1.p1 GENE.FR742824.1~~FR742824.1.p1  ORF type:complete len:207 (+),score=24.44 FR742824.1:55-621(+)